MSVKTTTKTRGFAIWLHALAKAGTWLLLLASVSGVTLLLMAFSGYFHEKVAGEGVSQGRPIPAGAIFVEAKEVVRPRYESAIGAVKPVHEAAVASKILARVLEIDVAAGKNVMAGDVLVRLSDEEQLSRVRQAEAERDSMGAQLELAKNELARGSQLIASRSISQAELDSLKTRVQTAQASMERAQRSVEEANVYLDFATVVAPFSGIVIDKVVQRGDTVSPGQVLLTLYDPTHMQLVANVRESLAMKLRVGQQIPARMESLDIECIATISEVVPKADTSSRSFEVKVTGPCPAGVYSGMFGRLLVPLEDEHLLLIPRDAIERVGQLTLVQVAGRHDRLNRRSVQLGRTIQGEVEVLSGLKAGERVLVQNPTENGASR